MTISKVESKVAPICGCGCGGTTKGGNYLPGHDAKYKKQLIEDALAGSKRAEAVLTRLGWAKFLEIRKKRSVATAHDQPRQPSRRRGRPPKSSLIAPIEHAVHVPGFDSASGSIDQ